MTKTVGPLRRDLSRAKPRPPWWVTFEALNGLDPSGGNRNSETTIADFFEAALYSAGLALGFRRSGRLALTAADYYDRALDTGIAVGRGYLDTYHRAAAAGKAARHEA